LLPGGFRGPDGLYYSMGEHGSFFGTASHGTEPFCVYTYNTTPHAPRAKLFETGDTSESSVGAWKEMG